MRSSEATEHRCVDGWQRLVWAAVWIVVCGGCATTQGVGVRSDYRNRDIQKVAVWPVYAAGSFDMDRGALDRLQRSTESRAVSWLKERGQQVVTPEAVASMPIDEGRSSAGSSSGEQSQDPLEVFDVELQQRYNPDQRHRPSRSARLLQQLHRDGRLGARYVLFGRILYHTETRCRVRADDFYERAEVAFAAGVSRRLPNRCVVTFLQFKLVDAERGATVWFNEGLRELHVDEVGRQVVQQNAARLVDRLLGGDDGLGGLIRGED